MNYVLALFKPMLSNKLKVKKLYTVTFKVNCIKDVFELEGTGTDLKTGIFGFKKCEEMKISENLEYKRMLDKNIKSNVKDLKEYFVATINMDFEQRFIVTEVLYIKTDGTKNKKEFKNTF